MPSGALTGLPALYGADVHADDELQKFPLGAIGYARGGNKVYRYANNGGTELDPGKITIAAAVITTNVNQLVDVAAAIDATKVVMNVGAASVTKDLYAEGELCINDATGEGISYWITGNSAFESSGTGNVYLGEPITVALVADTSEASMIENNWKDILISVNDQSDMAVGVPNVTISANQYGWVQTRGLCATWADETINIGLSAALGSSVGGSVETKDVDDAFADVGIAQQAAVDDEYRLIYLRID